MSPAEKRRVLHDVEHEGMHYAFASYDDYAEIRDPKFHELRSAYLRAAKELLSFLGHTGSDPA
jgi:hypothetical protein